MSRGQAEKAARHIIMSGFRHHSYEDERLFNSFLFTMEREAFIRETDVARIRAQIDELALVLAPTRLRAVKNAVICLVTTVSRIAIDAGANAEFCFALSDHYICRLEELDSEPALHTLARDLLLHYYDLVQQERERTYTKHVAAAIRYIARNLYSPCTVAEVAAHVRLERHYFGSLFARQTGLSPGRYILRQKLEEARRLLPQTGVTVTGVAEALCFCDTSHFSRQFKLAFGFPPSVLCRADAPRRVMKQLGQPPGSAK